MHRTVIVAVAKVVVASLTLRRVAASLLYHRWRFVGVEVIAVAPAFEYIDRCWCWFECCVVGRVLRLSWYFREDETKERARQWTRFSVGTVPRESI